MQETLVDKITVYIELDLEDEGKRDAIMKSLIADNIKAAQGVAWVKPRACAMRVP